MTITIATSTPSEAAGYTAMTRRASLSFIYVVAALFVPVALALVYLCIALDEQQVQHSETDAALAMESRQDKIGTALADYAFWNDAHKHMSGEVDAAWAFDGDNIGPSLFSTYGLDGVFVLGPDASTRYAIVNGELSDLDASDWIAGDLSALLASARSKSAQDGVTQVYFSVTNMPAVVSAAVIRPDSSYDDFENLSYLVYVDVLTHPKLKAIDEAFDLTGLTATIGALPDGPRPRLILQEDLGVAITLQWQSEALGRSVLQKFLPMLLLLATLVALLMFWLRRRVIHAADMIDAAQQALRVSEQRFKNISEASSDWIWETDSQQRLTFLSERFTQVTGLPCHAWIGRPLTDLLTYDKQLMAASAEAGNAAGRKPIPCEMRDDNQSLRHCQLSSRAVRVADLLRGYQGTVCDITEEIETKARIEHISQHDALTGLANRHRLNHFLSTCLSDGMSGESPVFVLALDLDRFKPINDTFGHAAGDVVLREVASALTSGTRETDLVARLGGDEFIVVATDCRTLEQAERLCLRLIEQINQPIRIGANEVSVGASIGIVSAPYDGLIADDLLRYADIALYEAKSSGRNLFRFYEPAMNERIMERRQLEMDMRQALRRHEFRLDFQPRYDAPSQTIVGAEALVRWQHPIRELLSPACFIPLAEETGLIVELSDWVLREACLNALSWGDELMVSVNLSPVEFQRSDLVDRVAKVLEGTGIAPHRLELEITESVMLEDAASALTTMNQLKALGVRLSMDDFGTGYSSLSYLRSYPFDGIKIDRSFISELDQSQSSEAIVHAIVSMGHALSLTVTAEGIETVAQLGKLTELACDQAQGFYLGRPMSPLLFQQVLADAQVASVIAAGGC
ncbi:bifunctional diguanylate cyclase/phosphodiesterase [Pseudomonas sp. Choline-3u-10]|jgi:diguanylate cyclase (GGDEF)-like protein/PAS domain S-box-containing protein|uniref:bifunctional diguanylate cyclase/phosphodiesterase n=1 Tax=Pseudomonadaceae TaxID=135621 RepID=UPI00061810E0|nr:MULTISPECIES: EAL domain-containing protein [Pseudomonadaceae]MAL35838.1 bifunctional diguanylate cyclase/phosphodiesterase [Pseudomonas sp.]MBK3795475.1 EAL domain-containing protein [Stutzerimonas stutzeri]MBK3878170.1 EAL domain-containing protein [Stutzerimonas stutzeri]PKG92322.1 bifunctional diguanylate cyclase/phosphodiesterase [Pseudomonas sp. Choline-3u-10]HBM08482.1 bifunctional diguanylate cyclase/phosphodiesterase [Pseudomonas sp.]